MSLKGLGHSQKYNTQTLDHQCNKPCSRYVDNCHFSKTKPVENLMKGREDFHAFFLETTSLWPHPTTDYMLRFWLLLFKR